MSALCWLASTLMVWLCLWLFRVFVIPMFTLSDRGASKRIRSYMHDSSESTSTELSSPFALITGATGSIGSAFAEYLAREGYSLILTGRSESALEVAAKTISTKHPSVTILTRVCDLNSHVSIRNLVESLSEINVAVLVNNAGAVNVLPDDALDIPPKVLEDILAVNVQGTTLLTRLMLPKLKARKNCLIIFMGSITGSLPCPMVSYYSASKAYTHALGIALQEELRPSAITVLVAAPAWIASNMTLTKRTNLLIISPDHFVRCLFKARWTSTVVNPYYWHRVVESALGMLPEMVRTRMQYSQLTNARSKIQRKLKKDK